MGAMWFISLYVIFVNISTGILIALPQSLHNLYYMNIALLVNMFIVLFVLRPIHLWYTTVQYHKRIRSFGIEKKNNIRVLRAITTMLRMLSIAITSYNCMYAVIALYSNGVV